MSVRYRRVVESAGIEPGTRPSRVFRLVPRLHEQPDGKRVVCIFTEGIQNMLTETLCTYAITKKRLFFLQNLPISAQEIFNKTVKFHGSFFSDCQDQYISLVVIR